jgi:hypothetical protein
VDGRADALIARDGKPPMPDNAVVRIVSWPTDLSAMKNHCHPQ